MSQPIKSAHLINLGYKMANMSCTHSTVRACKLVFLTLAVALASLTLILLYESKRDYIIEKFKVTFIPSEFVSEFRADPPHRELSVAPWTGRSLKPLFDDMRPMTLQSDYDYLQNHLTSAGLNLSRLAILKMHYDPLPMETELLHDPGLLDPLLTPNETFTQVTVVDARPEYTIGHTVTVKIDVRDGYDQPLLRGGDVVFLWVVQEEKNASMAVDVKDLNNGTYLATIPFTWVGLQRLKVSVRYPREAMKALLYLRHVMKTMRYVAAGYIGPSASESTLCSPFPRVPGYQALCNYTRRNHGQPWYCGKPRKPGLRCEDWVIMRDLEFVKPLPLTAAEETLFMTLLLSLGREAGHLSLAVTSGQHQAPPPCDKENYTHTWFDPAPRGFFMHRVWVPTACTVPPPHPELWTQCLKDTIVVLAGDSNLLMWFQHIKNRIQCLESRLRQDTTWHTPLTCTRKDIKFSMHWQLHGYPEHPNSNHWARLVDFRSACERIDGIPSVGRYLVIVHLRVKCIRRAIESLLERNPSVKVMIRAPHTAYKGWSPIFGGDMIVHLYIDILRSEFKGLYDKVIFLNLWDMTVAGENADYHPDNWIDQQMINYALGHACNM